MSSISRPKTILTGSIGISYDVWLPYAAGCLISYAKQNFSDDEFIFSEPLYKILSIPEILHRMQNVDALALTCYSWNESSNSSYSQLFKALNPKGLIIWGGPQIPKSEKAFQEYAANHPFVDCFVSGAGEELFVEILKKWKKNNFTTQNLPLRWDSTQKHLPRCLVTTPYLDGTFDSILKKEKKIKASFETNRGCPYRCSFCDWGGQANSKIIKLPEDLVHATIDAIFQYKNITEVEILDANFGLFEQDLKYVQKMCEAKQKYTSEANVSYSGLAKNGSPYLEPILLLLTEHFQVSQRHLKVSFQSHSQEVLQKAQRSNIKEEKLLEILKINTHRKLKFSSEMILGLPGETAQSWAQTLQKDILLGIHFTRAYILSISENTLLADATYQNENKIKLKKVFFPTHFKSVDRKKIYHPPSYIKADSTSSYEQHKLIYECSSYDLQELKKIYTYWWFHHNFFNSHILSKTIISLLNDGHSYQKIIDHFIKSIKSHHFLNSLLLETLNIIDAYYKPEEESYIDDYRVYYYSTGPMRIDDIYVLWKNQIELKKILELFILDISDQPNTLEAINDDLSQWTPVDGFSSSLLGAEARIKEVYVE